MVRLAHWSCDCHLDLINTASFLCQQRMIDIYSLLIQSQREKSRVEAMNLRSDGMAIVRKSIPTLHFVLTTTKTSPIFLTLTLSSSTISRFSGRRRLLGILVRVRSSILCCLTDTQGHSNYLKSTVITLYLGLDRDRVHMCYTDAFKVI